MNFHNFSTTDVPRILQSILIGLAAVPLIASVPRAAAATVISQHVDVQFDYSPSTGWTTIYRYGDFENPVLTAEIDEAVLPVRDQLYVETDNPQLGDRDPRRPSDTWNFTGASAGDPIWMLSQVDNDFTWPGLRSASGVGVLSGNEFDVALLSMTYLGQAPSTPYFSMWTFGDFGIPEVHMQTFGGIDPAVDKFTVPTTGHLHMAWTFTALGIYQLELQARGVDQATGQPTASDPVGVTFTVGTYANWLGEHFLPPQLVDPLATGPLVDADGNGTPILIDYAFNCSPVNGKRENMEEGGTGGLPLITIREHEGQPYLTAEYVRRKAETNPQIKYTPKFADNLEFSGATEGVLVSSQSIDETWKRVVVRDTVAVTAANQRFASVRVELLETISY